MIRHINALNDTIKYRYHFSQLTDVEYPRYPANNVHYQYGTVSNTDINAVGKVIRQTDASGLQIFSYGKLGELTENIRTFALPYESHTYTFKMHYEYDSWNRIQSMTYPDGEVVHYDYNRGGILKRVTCNKNGVSSEYIRDIRYNKFELKTSVVYGNSTRNVYEYDSLFRLSHLRSYKLHDTLMQDLTYTYDSVGNILQISNSAAMLSNGLGGNYTNIYTYDDLYRLSEALCRGTQVTMSYHANGRIHRKTVKRPDELHGRNSFIVTPFEYLYNSLHSNVVNGIRPYPYTCNPNEYVTIDEKAYNFLWDSCGNMTAHSKLYSDFARTMMWTEDNRLQCVADDSYLSLFLYDAGGERTYKLTGNYRLQNTNGPWFEYYTLENPTLYASPYLVATRHGYTKHYYAEGERIASKIGGGGISNIGHALICSGNTGAWDEALRQLNVSRFLPNSFLDLLSGLYDWRDSLRQENDVYFYHPDHLGSSSWITDANGEAVQHLEYLPWGEDLIDQKLSGFDGVRYTFSAKEKDSETGLSYFGSRYYSSDLSIWLSVDPMSDKYPSLSPYTYCANNPVRVVDPDGEIIGEVDEACQKKIEALTTKGSPDYNRAFARKYNQLAKSSKTYNFIEASEEQITTIRRGGIEINENGSFDIISSEGGERTTQEGGFSKKYATLFEETFHACEFDKGKLDLKEHTCLDEAKAWKFATKAPGTSFWDEKSYARTFAGAIKKMSIEQLSNFFHDGGVPTVDEEGRGEHLMGSKEGLYHNLKLK